MSTQISRESFDFTVSEEVSSEQYYQRHYIHPEWPGGRSGITVGIGYDLGMSSIAKIKEDWGDLVTPVMLATMVRCSGVTGDAARDLLPRTRDLITIPWEAGLAVFSRRDIPQWTSKVLHDVPGSDRLGPTCLGVLVDTAYNRGDAGFNSSSPRFAEMHAIHDLVSAGNYDDVADQFIKMERCWPSPSSPDPDLRRRCEHRASLWQTGLKEMRAGIVPPLAQVGTVPADPDPRVTAQSREDQPARTAPPATTPAQHATAAVIVAAGAGGAHAAASGGFSPPEVLAILAAAAVAAAVVWIIWYKNRNP